MIKVIHGDCLEKMKLIPDGSIDAIITDPPYGTTGVACVNTNRSFIGIEKDDKYFEVAKNRITESIKIKKGKLIP